MAQLLTRVRDRLDEDSAVDQPMWTQTKLRRWVNEGMEKIARDTECLLATTTITGVAGTQSYSTSAISPAFTRIHKVQYEPTGSTSVYTLQYRDFNVMDTVWGSNPTWGGYPEYWTAWGIQPSLSLILYPVPSVGGTIRLYYYRLPTKLDEAGSQDSSTLDLPSGWDDILVTYVEMCALRADRDPRWQEAYALFNTDLDRARALTTRPTDQGGMIVSGTSVLPHWLVAP